MKPNCWKNKATVPATCGLAIDVPLIMFVALALVCQVLWTELPGAIMSTQLPLLLNEEKPSLLALEATVIAAGTRAGE